VACRPLTSRRNPTGRKIDLNGMRNAARPARLGHRFNLLWAGQSASLVGDQVTLIALPLVASLYAGASTFEVGVLATLLKLPFLIIGLQAGVWVTRSGLARSMVYADVVRAAALAVIVMMLVSQERIPLAVLAGAVTAVGVATVFFQVALRTCVLARPRFTGSHPGEHCRSARCSRAPSENC
jgi:hypothetical protein